MKIEIETLENGTQGAYADKEWKYRIKIYSDKNDDYINKFVRDLCTNCISKCNKSNDDPTREFYETYYTLKLIGDRKEAKTYLYTVTSPYLD